MASIFSNEFADIFRFKQLVKQAKVIKHFQLRLKNNNKMIALSLYKNHFVYLEHFWK